MEEHRGMPELSSCRKRTSLLEQTPACATRLPGCPAGLVLAVFEHGNHLNCGWDHSIILREPGHVPLKANNHLSGLEDAIQKAATELNSFLKNVNGATMSN